MLATYGADGPVGSPRVLILNGLPCSGKSTLARALQDGLDEPWLHVDLDTFQAMLPSFHAGRPPEDVFHRMAAGCNAAVAAIVEAGNNILLELVARKNNPAASRVLADLFERFAGVETMVVCVRCSKQTALRREASRPEAVQGLVARDYGTIDEACCDAVIDSERLTIEQAVSVVRGVLSAGPQGGLNSLMDRLRDENRPESAPDSGDSSRVTAADRVSTAEDRAGVRSSAVDSDAPSAAEAKLRHDQKGVPVLTRWRQLLDYRTAEAIRLLGEVDGVHGLIVGGSVGRGEPWPMSDIDLLPVYEDRSTADEVARRQSELVDWWAASGWAQTLDVGWLCFTTGEITAALASPPADAAVRMTDRRWFHGIDKAYAGRAADPDDELTTAFLRWIGEARFAMPVREARIASWRARAEEARSSARMALDEGDRSGATAAVRQAAAALCLVLVEHWGERLGSMGREWTQFERMAGRHGRPELITELTRLAGADPRDAIRRAESAPPWLVERIERCWHARQLMGEDVTPEQNARDQLVAFSLHVFRRRPDLLDDWTGIPDPDVETHLNQLDDLLPRTLP